MSNFDFSLVNYVTKLKKEKIKQEKEKNKRYVVMFGRSASMEVDGNQELEVRIRDITVFEGSLEQCEAYIKYQMIDWMTSLLDVDIYSRSIEIKKTWQHLDKVMLSMHDFDKEDKFYSSYSYYTIYDENYYENYEF